MRRSMQLILGLLSILLAAGAGFYGRNAYLYQVSTILLPVPQHDIPPYTVLSADFFVEREFPRSLSSLPYYPSVSDLTGRITTVTLPAGLPIAHSAAATAADFRLADATYEVLSIPVQPVSAVGGQIRIGARINLYRMRVVETQKRSNVETFERANAKEGEVTLIVGAILVVDVRSARGETAGPEQPTVSESGPTSTSHDPAQTQILTLAIPPEQVAAVLQAIVEAEDAGGLLWASLALP